MTGPTRSRTLVVVVTALLVVMGLLYAVRVQVPADRTSPIETVAPIPATAIPALTVPTPTATATASSSSHVDLPLPGADRFALVVEKGCSPPGPPPYVRREDRNEVIASLGQGYLCQLHGAVSPDGRRLAYWLFETGRSEIALYQGGSSTTLVRLGDELLGSVVWSADGTGLLFVAMKGGVQGVAPEYAALRTLDLATGSAQELTRVAGRYLSAMAWDRALRVAAATGTSASGGAGEYLVITEDRVIRRNEMAADVVLMSASPDAAFMMALSRAEFVIRYWPLTSFEEQKELRAAPGLGAGIAVWRPGARELAVVVSGGGSQTLELWSLDGSRRRLTDYTGQGGGLFFRPDGSVAFIGGGTAVDVATGRVARASLAQGERLAASMLRPAALTTRTIELHPLADLLAGRVTPARGVAVADAWNGLTTSADGDRAMLYRERGPQAGPPPTIVDLKTGARTVLHLVNDPLDFFAFAGWLADGRVLVVGRKVWIGAADGSALREIADAVDLAGNAPWIALPSPSGRYVALWGYNPTGSLGFVDLQTGATKRVTGPFRRHAADAPVALAWSPDEKLLAGSDADGEFVEAGRRLRIVDPFSDTTVRTQAMPTVKIWWLASGDLLALLPSGETGAGARSAGALLDPISFVERRRFLGVNWYPSPDGRYLLQVDPSQGFVVTELFDLRSATLVPLRFEGGPIGWTAKNDLIIRR